ncbi:MAG: AMP-binding protein [Acidobacteria bacterium]|nr:AMP-binding protein [Acidobacteriota bacterium]
MRSTPAERVVKETTIPAVLRTACAVHGDREAIVDGEKRWTYAHLQSRVDVTAAALIASGLEPGDRVAIWAPNSAAWAAISYGVYAAGGVLVPISTRYKAAEAEYLLETAQVKFLFAVGSFLDNDLVAMRTTMGPLNDLQATIDMPGEATGHDTTWPDFIARAEAVEEAAVLEREAQLAADSPSDIAFTSGTTGAPKGAMLSHGASVATYLAWTNSVGLTTQDRYLITYPFFHTAGLKSGILASALVGATMHTVAVFDPEALMETVQREQITVLPGPPTVFQMMLDHPDRADFDLSSLRCSVTGAAVVPVEVIKAMRSVLDIDVVVTGYGLTETTGTVSMCSFNDSPKVVAGTVGRPLEGVEVRVVDADGVDQATGDSGEILVRGFNVMAGYFNDPEATAEAIDADGWLRTGDIGLIDAAGNLSITDRLKDMFIVGGFNAYPAEIESMMLERDEIVQVAVVGIADDRLGEVGAAFVVPADACEIDVDELRVWCRERMANFKVPRRFEIVTQLPMTPSGKVQKPVLRERLAAAESEAIT